MVYTVQYNTYIHFISLINGIYNFVQFNKYIYCIYKFFQNDPGLIPRICEVIFYSILH